ncbi:MAG: hypothetical protein IPM79_12460 [Polyangiaceae bacterium]|nr:hypothetical protein [Polyangiaceae bacterium]
MTATWRTREELVHQVVILAEQGVSRRALTRALGVSRNTVRALLRSTRARAPSPTLRLAAPARAPRASPLDAHLPRIVALLGQYEATAQRIFEVLREEGFAGDTPR